MSCAVCRSPRAARVFGAGEQLAGFWAAEGLLLAGAGTLLPLLENRGDDGERVRGCVGEEANQAGERGVCDAATRNGADFGESSQVSVCQADGSVAREACDAQLSF